MKKKIFFFSNKILYSLKKHIEPVHRNFFLSLTQNRNLVLFPCIYIYNNKNKTCVLIYLQHFIICFSFIYILLNLGKKNELFLPH